ncbi:hypothetical protein [Streptomyces cinereoruber]|uniref:hypothetical protein n=1 Tax=Streptomyces cinereoruber TaxID=67260 RepID=UPI00363A1802
MTPTPREPSTTPKIREALDARDALAAAPSRAGVQLPAINIRSPWPDEREGEASYALVHLEICSAPVAHAIATAIVNGLTR